MIIVMEPKATQEQVEAVKDRLVQAGFQTHLSVGESRTIIGVIGDKKEMSKVPAHYELIPEIIRLRDDLSPETKLLINGDIKDKAHALALHQKYPKVDGFMIGRGVFFNPYCFTDHQPTRKELMELLKLHLKQKLNIFLCMV